MLESDPIYRPPWYPNQNPEHNPWVAADASGETHYQSWLKGLAPGELERLIAEHQAAETAKEEVA
jgi:frataxin-like iron-binding protein CyaY